MSLDLHTEISSLRKTVKTAAGSAFVPAPALAAMAQACAVIELLAAELASMQQVVDGHLHAHLMMGS